MNTCMNKTFKNKTCEYKNNLHPKRDKRKIKLKTERM